MIKAQANADEHALLGVGVGLSGGGNEGGRINAALMIQKPAAQAFCRTAAIKPRFPREAKQPALRGARCHADVSRLCVASQVKGVNGVAHAALTNPSAVTIPPDASMMLSMALREMFCVLRRMREIDASLIGGLHFAPNSAAVGDPGRERN